MLRFQESFILGKSKRKDIVKITKLHFFEPENWRSGKEKRIALSASTDPNPLIHPVALDCAGDPDHCFVADYEGNTVYKVTWDHSTNQFAFQKSSADYYHPFAIDVQRVKLLGNEELSDIVWVSDRVNLTPPPAPGTWTPLPTYTPAPPTPPPGVTYTPPPGYTATPYPERQRVTKNEFGRDEILTEKGSTIPVALSVVGGAADYKCWVADRDANVIGNNEIKLIRNNTVNRIRGDANHRITRPVDVEAVE